jgi:hypothetical protein
MYRFCTVHTSRCLGLKVPEAAANALNMAGTTAMAPNPPAANMPPIATQCFMLSNMFDPMLERDPNWDQEIRDDVIEECNKHGGVVHIYVDKASSQVRLNWNSSQMSSIVDSKFFLRIQIHNLFSDSNLQIFVK